jgi:hypothetical protein
MKKSFLNIVSFITVLALLAGCATTDLDHRINFNQYKTFAWGPSDIKTENPIYNSDLINKNIKSTVENEFAKRGIMENEAHPDFLVSFHTYTEKEQSSGSSAYYGYPYFPAFGFYGMRYGWGMPYWGMPFGGYGYGGGRGPYTYTKGTLILDIKDKKTDEVIWRGAVSGNVDNVKTLERQIAKGVKAIMKKYPGTPDHFTLPDHKTIS